MEADFTRALVEATQAHTSWRARLQWVRDRFADPSFAPTTGQLATLAIYLRLLATGELKCEEDGRHFRPNHSAEAALRIEEALERIATPDTAWLLRRIFPHLPSWGDEFRRSEPLTRIRDIAHRNDIPHELKNEIKHRLQNKLHRCAGPEDLRTSTELLARITAAGANYSPDFVREFRIFHAELEEFFNATALEARLRSLADAFEPKLREAVTAFLELKAHERLDDEQLLTLLRRLTLLRQHFAERMGQAKPRQRSQLRLADIGLEDYGFTLLSECVNRLPTLETAPDWTRFFDALTMALDNLYGSGIEPEECAALRAELAAWASAFAPSDHFHLLRVLASLGRGRRLAESYTDRITGLFPPRVEELGRALGIAEHAIQVFSEGDIRGHVVFQFSRLIDLGLDAARQALHIPPWEAIVPGDASGQLLHPAKLDDVAGKAGPLLLLLDHIDGDAEIPSPVKGIVLGHPLPHLSHLGVRARQARVPLAAGSRPELLRAWEGSVGKVVRLRVTPEGLSLEETTDAAPGSDTATSPQTPISVPDVELARQPCVLPLEQAHPATCGAKAAGARRLRELAEQSGGLFHAPRGLAVPFGVMERCLEADAKRQREYGVLKERLQNAGLPDQDALLQDLRHLVGAIPVPTEIAQAVAAFFGPNERLAVRSSTNGEDLEQLAGAGLYESIVNVAPAAAAVAIPQVWASLWTRRAALSRTQSGIAHDRVRMAVLLQALIVPDLSFILHTVNPLTGNRDETVVELAVGLGEVLASGSVPGTPYRMACDRTSGAARLSACANFSVALRPERDSGQVAPERLNYAKVSLSADVHAAEDLGKRLAQIAVLLEDKLGRPQDVEGVCAGGDIHIVQARPQQGL